MHDAVILITRPGLGTTQPDDSPFGMEMLDKFLHTLERQADKPKAICFYTEGVKAALRGTPLEISLQLLQKLGVRLVVCESCIKHFGLDPDQVIGEIGGMLEIVRTMTEASKVITI